MTIPPGPLCLSFPKGPPTDATFLAAYADAVRNFVTSTPLLQEWPECRRALLEHLSKESSWALALPGLSCMVVGGAPADAIPVTAAWAALMQAAHILDAVQDGHNVPVAGLDTPETAINLATGLIFTAFHLLNRVQAHPGAASRVATLFSEEAFHSSLGQHLGLVQKYENMPVVEALEAYWRAVISKSGSAFRMATAGGAAAGTDSEDLIAALGEFGNCLGVILQILDDCRDVLTGSDVADYEVSLPLLLFLMATQNDLTGRQRIEIPNPGTPLSKEVLFDVLSEVDVPAIITDVLLEWRRRALNDLTPLERSEAVIALEGIVDHILTPSPLPGRPHVNLNKGIQ